MSEEKQFQPTGEPVRLVIDSKAVLVENHWLDPVGAGYLEIVERSKDMLILRMSPLDVVPHSCLFTLFLLLLVVVSFFLLLGPQDGRIIGFLPALIALVVFTWRAFGGIRLYVKCHSYFDLCNGWIRLGAFPYSPYYALTDLVAIQLLEWNRPWLRRDLQLNLVLMRKGPTALRINLQSGRNSIRHPHCLEVMRQSSNRLAEFLGVPVVEQRVAHSAPFKNKTELAKDSENLIGTWLLIEEDGLALTQEVLARTMMRTGSGFKIKRGQDILLQGRFLIDSCQQPMHIDVEFITGREQGKTSLGIYNLDGDIYKECLAGIGKPRPKAFQFQPGINRLSVYRRVK
jgi:uncharacterized protein (TIGR03067 family)